MQSTENAAVQVRLSGGRVCCSRKLAQGSGENPPALGGHSGGHPSAGASRGRPACRSRPGADFAGQGNADMSDTSAKEPPDPFDLTNRCDCRRIHRICGGQEADYRDSDTQAQPAGFRPRPPGSGVSRRSPSWSTSRTTASIYVVRPELAAGLAGETISKTVYTAINRQRTLFLWPVTLPPPDDRDLRGGDRNEMLPSWRCGQWVRVKANLSLGLTRSPWPVA